MCRIIKNPTLDSSFFLDMFPRLSQSAYDDILAPFLELGLPLEASLLTLHLADMWERDNRADTLGVGITVPFAIYEAGRRIVSPTSILLEEGFVHLAMAGTALIEVNAAAIKHFGGSVLMGHCCEITWGDGGETMIMGSAGRNLYRKDQLDSLRSTTPVIISDADFALRMQISAGAAFLLTANFLNMQQALAA